MGPIPAAARLHAFIRRGADPDALPAEADPVALCGEFCGEDAADHGGWVDRGVSADAESGGKRCYYSSALEYGGYLGEGGRVGESA